MSTSCSVVLPQEHHREITPSALVAGELYIVTSSDLGTFHVNDVLMAVEYPKNPPLESEKEGVNYGWYAICGLLRLCPSLGLDGQVYRPVHVGTRLKLRRAPKGSLITLTAER